jgi:hypothetical protein
MPTVTGMTATAMQAIADASVVSGSIDESGQVTFTTRGGTELDGGNIMPTVPDASETVKGILELASSTDVSTGTDTTKAVTPAGLATALTEKQPLDGDLTAIAGLTPANNDVLQRISGGWINRTMAQLKTALGLTASDVGLGSVDNTADTAKPVSAAQLTALNGKVDKSLLTAKGDLFAATASATPARLAVGSNGQVLTADSTQTDGMRWATPASAGKPAWWTRARSGIWYPLTGYGTVGGTGPSTMTSNVEYAMPMTFGFSASITGLAINKVDAVGNIRLGIRNDSGSMAPGTVAFDSGAKGTAAGVIAATSITGVTVSPGVPMWFTVTSQGGGGQVTMQSIMHPFVGSVSSTTPITDDFEFSQPGMYTSQTGVSGALSSTFTISGNGGDGDHASIVMKVQFGSITQGP